MSKLVKEFDRLARKYFSFLETSFGFVLHAGESILRYETQNVYVLIGYDSNRSYELSIDLGRRSSTKEPPFNFGEILRSVKAPEMVPFSYQASSEEVLERCLEKLAQSLWKYGADFLRNDTAAFLRLAEFRQREGAAYALSRDLRLARTQAEAAWVRKDYAKVIRALEALEAHLTPAEMNRLTYSRKHSQS